MIYNAYEVQMCLAANKNIHNARDEYRFRDNLRVELAKALTHEGKTIEI
jgi:hypothetical protein